MSDCSYVLMMFILIVIYIEDVQKSVKELEWRDEANAELQSVQDIEFAVNQNFLGYMFNTTLFVKKFDHRVYTRLVVLLDLGRN